MAAIELRHLDARAFASNLLPLTDSWGWIIRAVAFEFGCSPDDVQVVETDDGDVITVSGHPKCFAICLVEGKEPHKW